MSDERNWEGATDDELSDGIDDGEPEAMAEYGSRLWHRLQRAEALLRRWSRKGNHPGLQYETVAFLDGVEAARALSSALREGAPSAVVAGQGPTLQDSQSVPVVGGKP